MGLTAKRVKLEDLGGLELTLEDLNSLNLRTYFEPKAFSIGKVKVYPVAYDSFGVRSMATFIETPDLTIFIDPSAALGPNRWGLPPSRFEEEALRLALEKVRELVPSSDIIVITHYHFDHYSPELTQLYKGRRILLKHPSEKINRSQFERARQFLTVIAPDEVIYADSRRFKFGSTEIVFSEPLPHGIGPKLGYVLQVGVRHCDDRVVHSSDVQGFVLEEHLNFSLEFKPQLLLADGPPTYLIGTKFPKRYMESFKKAILKLMKVGVKLIVLDHHLMRDKNWCNKLEDLLREAELRGIKLLTASKLIGRPNLLLEAYRRDIYKLIKEN